MIPRTDFHCITTWVAGSSGEIRQCICLFCGFVFTSQIALLFNINIYFDCKTKLCLTVPDRHEKIYIYLHKKGILNDINKQDSSFLYCKHKHMMKSGAPPDKVPFHMFTYRIPMASQAELILRVITLWCLVLSQFFLKTVWVPLKIFLYKTCRPNS